MKNKFFVISLLILMLSLTVCQMMKYEESIREEKIITHYVDDATKPLIEKLNIEQLQQDAVNTQYMFKTGETYFKCLQTKNEGDSIKSYWESIFLKGVNLGVAIPGKFPAEFSLSFDDYLSWLKSIGEMNSNVIRLYTILPPDFYKALAYYNLNNHNKPVYIMQGIWAKIPKDRNYFNTEYTRDFQQEIINAIDVIHGKAVLKPQRGKANGTYTVNISKYVIAFLLGREWEPECVYATNRRNNTNHFDGNFICINQGNAMEVWLAKMMDYTVLYETQTYQWQHPISFVNWLPLDPMFHNTEIIENKKVRESDNDLSSIDFRKYNATPLFHAGIYATYHAYPYYPDFVFLQESYAQTINHRGNKDNFFGYLKDLKQYTQGMPLIIAEYGLPSSRGISHFTPSGFNHGKHSEAQQADLSLILTEDIYETKCAGAIYFEWADEWFKHNWLVMDFEVPFFDRKIWHNMENPEQNFGILALESRKKTIDASLKDWDTIKIKKNKIQLLADADPTYFYAACKLPNFDFSNNNLYIAIDTYNKTKGDHKLPFSDKYFENGFEFLCEFKSTDDAKILVDEPYSVFSDIYNDNVPVYASKYNENGLFIDQLMLVNRARETLLDEKHDSIVNNRSPLIFGNSSQPEFSNADWYWSNTSKTLELRLDWHLINVSDPAKRFVLDDKDNTRVVDYSKTDEFNIYLFITDKDNNIISQYPEKKPFSYIWEKWDNPTYTERLKPIYKTLQTYFHHLKPKKNTDTNSHISDESFTITNFFDDKKGAVSLSFDNAGYSQYELALPILNTYNIEANFSVIPDIIEDAPGSFDINEGVKLKRMGYSEIREITNYGNEIALQTESKNIYPQINALSGIDSKIKVLHLQGNKTPENVPEQILFTRNTPESKVLETSHDSINYTIAKTSMSQKEMNSLLQSNKDQWTIFIYHNLYKDTTEVSTIKKDINENYFIEQDDFKKQIRLIRNSNYWIAPESSVFKYLKEKQHSEIEEKRFGNHIFLKVKTNLDPLVYNQAISIRMNTKAKIIKIVGSANDGIYTNRTGHIIFNAYPNKEVKLEIIQK